MFGFFQKVDDPVCKMKVDKDKTSYSSEYKGEKHYFCSENCKSQFDASPKNYVENTTNSCCQNQTKASANQSCC